jgi:flavoprotein
MKTKDVIHGVKGVTKAVLGVDRAPSELIKKRLAICKVCPKASRKRADGISLNKCTVCGCYLELKTKVKSETCPLEKW